MAASRTREAPQQEWRRCRLQGPLLVYVEVRVIEMDADDAALRSKQRLIRIHGNPAQCARKIDKGNVEGGTQNPQLRDALEEFTGERDFVPPARVVSRRVSLLRAPSLARAPTDNRSEGARYPSVFRFSSPLVGTLETSSRQGHC